MTVAPSIPDRSTVLPLSFAQSGRPGKGKIAAQGMMEWYCHAAEYMGAEKNLVLYSNYEGNTLYFPMRWREGKDPYSLFDGKSLWTQYLPNQPPCVDMDGYQRKSGTRIDYVITWCLDSDDLRDSCTLATVEHLKRHYDLIFISAHGLAQVYRNRDDVACCSGDLH